MVDQLNGHSIATLVLMHLSFNDEIPALTRHQLRLLLMDQIRVRDKMIFFFLEKGEEREFVRGKKEIQKKKSRVTREY